MLQVTLFNGTKRQQIVCLVDSGADECLFHASIARSLGIDVESGRYKEFDGIAGGIEAYIHPVEIQIQDFAEQVKIEAGFTESEGVHAILGQAGFFENFRICFARYRRRIEVGNRPEPTRSSME
ncbi:MAG TPA: retropepsin-like aspartic protease [Pyrinomonadaceae bacterium]|nr:retropepsin-like aspartic protease [Pyrinomonadaceae bacterium]